MKAIILSDNKSCGAAGSEWGLSVYIEYNGKNILLDAGASDLFYKNAELLGVDISSVDYAVLSHAHFDHADGMKTFFEKNSSAKFYLRDACGENCYVKVWLLKKYIGIPKGITRKYSDRIEYVSGDYVLADGASLIPHKTPGLEAAGRANNMYVKVGNRMMPDNFSHEQSLVFDTEDGLVIFNSCSHGGADNIIREVQQTFPGRRVKAIAGGFHLYKKTPEEVRALAARIKETGIEQIYTGHCTGDEAFEILKSELGDSLTQLEAGLEIQF